MSGVGRDPSLRSGLGGIVGLAVWHVCILIVSDLAAFVYVGAMAAGGAATLAEYMLDATVAANAFSVAAAVQVGLLFYAARHYAADPWEFLGIVRPKAADVLFWCAAAAAFAALAICVAEFAGFRLMSVARIGAIRSAETAGALPAYLAIALAMRPLCEEIAFRGFLQSGYQALAGPLWASLFISLVCAVGQTDGSAGNFAFLLLSSLVFAFARVASRSVIVPLAAHSLVNGMLVLHVLATN